MIDVDAAELRTEHQHHGDDHRQPVAARKQFAERAFLLPQHLADGGHFGVGVSIAADAQQDRPGLFLAAGLDEPLGAFGDLSNMKTKNSRPAATSAASIHRQP